MFIWFGAIVPGHRRGVVTVPGASSECDCCACACSETSPPNTKASDPSQAPANPSSKCAICDFAAHLTLPPPFEITLLPLGLAARAADPTIEDRVARIVLTPYDGRGPPIPA